MVNSAYKVQLKVITMKEDDIADNLNKLKNIASQRGVISNELTNLFPGKDVAIPLEVLALLGNFDDVNDIIPNVFLGYDLLDGKEIAEQYNSLDKTASFFAAYDLDDSFALSEDMYIYLEDRLNKPLENSDVISNLKNYMPLLSFQGDYIVVDLNENNYGSLITIVDGHLGSFLAPSIMEHLSDLICGLDEGVYLIDDEDIVYPSAWYKRCLVRLGKAKMDKYGDLM